MNNDVKPNPPPPPFRFRRPWETPPREDVEEELQPPLSLPLQQPPNHHHEAHNNPFVPSSNFSSIPIKLEIQNDPQQQQRRQGCLQQEDSEMKDVKKMQIKVEKREEEQEQAGGRLWSEEVVEVFSFDREKLVLTSEKVRVKRESTEITSPTSPPSNSTSSSIDVEGNSSSSKEQSSGNSSSSRFICSSGGGSSNSSDSSSSSTDSTDQRRRLRLRRKRTQNKLRKNMSKLSNNNKVKDEPTEINNSKKGSSTTRTTDLNINDINNKGRITMKNVTMKEEIRGGVSEAAATATATAFDDDDDDEIENDEQQLLDVNDESNNSELDDEEDDDDDEYDDDDDVNNGEGPAVKLRLPADFPDFPGRNRERKNSKWADYGVTRKSSRLRSTKAFCNKSHKAQAVKKLTSLLKKDPGQLTEDDKVNLTSFPELAEEARKRLEKRHLASERMKEEEDPVDQLDKKCDRLAQVISQAKYVVLYTGAGISTSASIPDYRGPNGIWTLLRKGQALADDLKQFPQSADPTFTHMAIRELYERGVIKHIVSQNVDGLHLRSGIPKTALSEVHGNMYIEVCLECHREYVRLFDVTENTKRHHHKTGRYCYHCGSPLKDSVVLFGEKGSLRWPINWAGAEYNVDKADVILCLGSSLKVLRRYPWLWCMSKPAKLRPKLYIVNLQWTPKDRFAALKINGRCDEVIAKIMDNLKIPVPDYRRELDPIFSIATPLHSTESATRLSKDLIFPNNDDTDGGSSSYPQKSTDLQNYFRFEPIFCKEVRALNEVKRKVVDGEKEVEKDGGGVAPKTKSCGIGWLGNALSGKPKKKKVK